MTATRKPAAAATAGVLAGLATIFLPLLQALPQHVAAPTVSTAVTAGSITVFTSILGYLAHHGILTLTEARKYVAGAPEDIADLRGGLLDVRTQVQAVDPKLAAAVDATAAKYRADLARFAAESEAKVGVTAGQVHEIAADVFRGFLTAATGTPSAVNTVQAQVEPTSPVAPDSPTIIG